MVSEHLHSLDFFFPPHQNVKLIVQNALKLYSEDRIGLVDYALESGGTVTTLPIVMV